ncbi:hypothetical protein Lbir_3055 [Legionella birminghamensis]|uniref:Uncharacterized protein n=1 Tax=Legionella birminghamensis TaxID=28083 RepID=A0A378IDT5_9GAMM|nr:hypothetical protein [Legionella birminghamensis]KTC66753.1 hypothetical protein Lbir_3055 [Legionella birminghamensis]STX32902.1 Uncharacterised protein [Legionella birminghamensis]
MDFIKKLFCFLGICVIISNGFSEPSAIPVVCDQEYALCTSARCIPLPGSSDDAICDCVVEKGKSVGFTSCDQRKPGEDKYKAASIVSTFSFEQFSTKRPINCSQGMPWTNCVDMPCTVDPQNKKRALCKCKIDNTQAFFTFGGDCDISTCATGFWSGSTPETAAILRKALMQATGLKSMTTPAVCGVQSSEKDSQ